MTSARRTSKPILYGWKEGAAHYFVKDRTQDTVMLEDAPDFKGMKKQELLAFIDKMLRDCQHQTTVHFENKPSRNALHPTMKPVPLVGRLMNNSSKPGWLVGDFFGGSGSTLMAAEQLGRTAYIMEMDERNCDVALGAYSNYFRIYHKSGVVPDGFAVEQVTSIPSEATAITIHGMTVG